MHWSSRPVRGIDPLRVVLLGICLLVGPVSFSGCQKKQVPPAEGSPAAPLAAAPVPVTVAQVEVRPVQRRVSVVGTLDGMERITVTPKVEGRVLNTHFDVGDRVPPDTTLLELDPVDYQLAVNEAQQAVDLELARLDLTQPPTAAFDIEQLPSVQSARIKLDNTQRVYDRQKNLSATSAGTKQGLEQAETDLKVAETGLRQSRIDARGALAAVEHREALLMLAKQKLSETTVKTPKTSLKLDSGKESDFVVAERLVSVGEMVRAFPSTPVYELIVDDVLKLRVMVPERYISQVKLGLDVEIRVEAFPHEVFPGKVVRINPTINRANRSFEVEAHIPNPEHRLKAGGFAKADVVVGTAEAAVTVPVEAVTRFAGVSKVFRITDNKAQEVELSMGTQGSGWVEAITGLSAGDVIVTSGQSRLANGAEVTIRDSAEAPKPPSP